MRRPKPAERPLRSVSVDRAVVDRTLIERNAFSQRLIGLTRATILDDWKIGRSSDGATLFWYQGVNGQFVNAKKVWYDNHGLHRAKADSSKLPRFLYSSRRGFRTCLYGEFQLSPEFAWHDGTRYSASAPVVLVESEKTAVLMSHYASQYIWIASGGATALTRRKASVLRGRTVFVLYDCDEAGKRGAKRASALLEGLGIHSEIINQFELLGSRGEAKDGFDIADSVIAALFKGRTNQQGTGGPSDD